MVNRRQIQYLFAGLVAFAFFYVGLVTVSCPAQDRSMLPYLRTGTITDPPIGVQAEREHEWNEIPTHPGVYPFGRSKVSARARRDTENEDRKESVEVLLWDGSPNWAGMGSGNDEIPLPNYVGHVVKKPKCSVACSITGNKDRLPFVDAVLFEPQAQGSGNTDKYIRDPLLWPQKRVGQKWVNFGYETPIYFPLGAEPMYLAQMEVNMTYEQKYGVPITFTCNWGGGSLDDFLKPPAPKNKNKIVAFMATNCGGGGAESRIRYVEELMKYMKVDSLGGCLHNTDMPEGMRDPIYSDHGRSMRNKIQVFSEYKFVLAFENNNVTDYVSEKMPNVFQAGAVPVYMGAPNAQDWVPQPHSVILTADFKGPRDLANYLLYLNENDTAYYEYFAWKKKPLSQNFVDKYNRCLFYGGECRLCEYLHQLREAEAEYVPKDPHASFDFSLQFDGRGEAIVKNPDPALNLGSSFTISAWVYPRQLGDGLRIVDKNKAGTVDGFNLDIHSHNERAYVRICAGSGCFTGRKPLFMDQWYHIAVSYHFQEGSEFNELHIYVNGIRDSKFKTFQSVSPNDHPLIIGASNSGNHFNGLLDDISIWNVPLPRSLIRKLLFTRLGGNEDGLVAYYGFNEGTGLWAHDSGPYKQHAKMDGLEWKQVETKPLNINPFL